jgi:kynurenine formamidase
LALERVAGVPGACLDRRGGRTIELAGGDLTGLVGHAVLVRTDHSQHFGTDRYAQDHPHLSAASAEALVEAGVACVGIDSLNIDGTSTGERPVHSILLAAGIPIVEHLTALGSLPERGFVFTAVPPKIEGAGTFTVRAFASV